VPEGFLMLAPTKFLPFVTSSLFSWCGKARMAMDLILPRGSQQEDESLASFVLRRLGREALERAAQPLVGGIYTADPHSLSLRATMPRFLDMEEEHRSVILAMWQEGRKRRIGESANRREDSGARYSLFVSFDRGTCVLINALAARLSSGVLRFNQRVESVSPRVGNGRRAVPSGHSAVPKRWRIALAGGEELEADGVIVTTPAYHAASLVGAFDYALASLLSDIPYASSVVVNLAYRRADVPHPLDGFGFVVPAIEKRNLIACSFSSVKFAGRAPDDHALLRCFLGGALQPEMFFLEDDALLEAVQHDLRDLLGVIAPPLFSLISRHPKSMPQYAVGHLQHVAQINTQLEGHPNLFLAGNAYGGVGIPDCVKSGEEAAEKLVAALNVRVGEGLR
jgi:oxygen-dependent protoporphyrinogen oxidase